MCVVYSIMCVVVLWLFWGFVVFRPAHLSLTRSNNPHWPQHTQTHAHTHPYIHIHRMARLQGTGQPSAAEAQLHTNIGILLAFTGTGLFTSGHCSLSLSPPHTHSHISYKRSRLISHNVFLLQSETRWTCQELLTSLLTEADRPSELSSLVDHSDTFSPIMHLVTPA